ncbi:endonuclease domain-containing protein [Mycobacterium bourgelatii]|uniref:DUF559 domain-containing protein n=1 Tax=Mycobacterium bourgelatii TaxID=1273442 RepID=A0A7I9YXC0_MYCBU|nr:DUF559 domain-containing protein [Mycobacterium bourgelatii]MCV6972944.1 DUF559 domain-containing protein [Mycobacterium bourgelatii]GFG93364.1 hypothetical protein MBOU_54060 [Mycobacterium bourgelatii]
MALVCGKEQVFIGKDAVTNGDLTRYELQRWYRPFFPGIYTPKEHTLTLRDRTVGAWLWSGRKAVIAGAAASALHGAQWVDHDTPIELIWTNTRPPQGIAARDATLCEDEITRRVGLPVTTVARTAYDLGRQLPRGEAVARLDALMYATSFSIEDVLPLAKRYTGARGTQRLLNILPLVDGGAASPKETWLRLLLIDAGFPTPETQIPVSENLWAVGVVDMGWERYKIGVEYDGDQHRTDRRRYVGDLKRLRKLERLGWIIIRVINEDKPDEIVALVREALLSRGWRP